jgi:hypothetical protein
VAAISSVPEQLAVQAEDFEDGEAAGARTAAGILRRQSLRESGARTYARSLPVVPVRARG